MKISPAFHLLACLVCLLTACRQTDQPANAGWPEYLGGPDRNHYSELTQINTSNVQHLQIAWTYDTPDSGQMQVNPLIVDGMLYGVTPFVQAFALDAATKDEKFRAFDKKTGRLLWETTLPAAAFATPSTYAVNGKQYVVLACGGTKLGTKKGNKYVAFALK
jgi:quinoprotein glucose dehydrogenase